MAGPRILLIVGGGIAAYKACELVRIIRKGGGSVTCVLTQGGSQFVTAMSLAALSENPVHTTLWDLRNEVEMGHIQLSRESDLVVVCPATADLLAKMSSGIADDLATTLLLATDKPVMAVPAMNVRMWEHASTQRNVAMLRDAGVFVMDPDEGPMACGEFGPGRLPDPQAIWSMIASWFTGDDALPMLDGGTFVPLDTYDAPLLSHAYEYGQEPEADVGDAGSALGGLSASLISRSARRAQPLDDQGFDDAYLASDPGFFPPPEVPPPGLEGSLASSLLVSKGGARSAPPTDPEAMNHIVANDGRPAPEPIEGDVQPVSVGESPLAGQPDFADEPEHRPLLGKHLLVTAGPTHEPIDPVRYIANRSSGKQGFAIAAAAAAMGARVTLVAGPVNLPTPPGVDRIDVESARDMAAAVKDVLPVDCAIMVAAVSDWRTKDVARTKIKKRGSAPPVLMLTENPDILATVAALPSRPGLLIGFAAETDNVIANAIEKRQRKAVDWIIANDVSMRNGKSVMGGKDNAVFIVTKDGVESLSEMPKDDVARVLVERIADELV
jgi:phosphopantothenoylcysteine decarboxylase/phosphopantothenate--cysteine ligase